MNWVYGQLNMKKGEVFAEVRIHALNSLPIIVPPDEVQNRVVELVETVEAGMKRGDVAGVQSAQTVLEREINAIYGVPSEQMEETA